MRSVFILGFLFTVLAVFSGCGDSGENPPALAVGGSSGAEPQAGPNSEAAPVSLAANTGNPQATVVQFYEALKAGDETQIAALLTDKAREETKKSGLDIRSPGSDSLTYEIGESEFVTEAQDGAHVKTMWSQTDADGNPMQTEVIWVLRKQSNGWRVAGMATQVAEGQLPLLFNFEEPIDMLQKKDYVENELNRDPANPAAETGTAENIDGTSTGEVGAGGEFNQATLPANPGESANSFR